MAPNNNTNSLSPKCKDYKTEENSSTGPYSKFMNYASDDLLLEIFLRLPDCRTVTQSSIVSKHLYCLISSPQFVRNFIHHRHSYNNNNRQQQEAPLLENDDSDSLPCTFLIQGRPRRGNTPQHDGPHQNYKSHQIFSESSRLLHWSSSLPIGNYLNFLPKPVVPVASYDDLLLVAPFPRSPCYYLCNPLTRKWMALPPAPYRGVAPSGVGLVCEPESCSIDKDLGCYSNAEYKFKVVQFFASPFNTYVRLITSIFCAETQRWTDSAISIPPRRMYAGNPTSNTFLWCCDPLVASNRNFYWLNDVIAETLVIFDPFLDVGSSQEEDEKRWSFFKTPIVFYPLNPLPIWGGNFCLRVCGNEGRVRVAQFPWFSPRVLKVWELDDDNSWDEIHDEIVGEQEYVVLGFKPSDEDVVLLYSQDNHVFEYDIEERTLESVQGFHVENSEEGLDCVHFKYSVFPLVHPVWPTPIPALPSI